MSKKRKRVARKAGPAESAAPTRDREDEGVPSPVEVSVVPLAKLTPLADNLRSHTTRGIDFIASSLDRVGAARSGVIDEDRVILAGNGMRQAAVQCKRLGVARLFHFADRKRAELVGTTRFLQWTDEFSKKLAIESGAKPTDEQKALYRNQRNYILPTLNRGEVVRVAYLNAALTEHQPSLWIEIVHKGVKVEYRPPHNVFMGVSQSHAALAGSTLGLAVLGTVIWFIDATWIASVICMVYGLSVMVPGVVCIKTWRWLRDFLGG